MICLVEHKVEHISWDRKFILYLKCDKKSQKIANK